MGEAKLTPEEFSGKHITFLLDIVYDVVVLLTEQGGEATFISGDLLDYVEGGSGDFRISEREILVQERKEEIVKVKETISVEHPAVL